LAPVTACGVDGSLQDDADCSKQEMMGGRSPEPPASGALQEAADQVGPIRIS